MHTSFWEGEAERLGHSWVFLFSLLNKLSFLILGSSAFHLYASEGEGAMVGPLGEKVEKQEERTPSLHLHFPRMF